MLPAMLTNLLNNLLNRVDVPMWPHGLFASAALGVMLSVGLFLAGL